VPSESDPGGEYIGSVAASRNGVLAFRSGDYGHVALTWFDRSGRKLQTVSEPFKLFGNATNRLSPDDSRAIVVVQGSNSRPDLWIADLERGTFTRFTFDGAVGGIWSPDGTKILWADWDYHHYLKAADGSGNNELLYKNPNCYACLVYDWSQDGKLSSFGNLNGGKVDIWFTPLDGDRKPFPFRQVDFNNFYGMFSPDHRWLAYTSDESGRNQIYIDSIPAGKKRWQVSNNGGNWPIWRRDGKELFYRQGSSIVAVPIHLTDIALEIGKPQSLFTVPPGARFQVSRDGQRFLVALPVEGTPGLAPITVDTDWRAGLKK
jgi:Tol biopolymer transport system component